jgi:hypothetical protein
MAVETALIAATLREPTDEVSTYILIMQLHKFETSCDLISTLTEVVPGIPSFNCIDKPRLHSESQRLLLIQFNILMVILG